MNKKFSYSILIGVLVLGLIAGILRPLDFTNFKVLGLKTSQENQNTIKANFFAEQEFYNGMLKAENNRSSFSGDKIYGGVIPHHLLPGYIITDFFEHLSAQNPKKIILIGPNHKEIGGIKPISSSANWDTQFGIVNSDYSSIETMISEEILVRNDEVITNEHSIGGILHYIKYYLPNTTVMPIIVSGLSTPGEVSNLANSLEKYIDEDTVIIASVDFSHYLSASEAVEKDIVTREVIENFNYEKLYQLNNDYIDSPQSIAALLNLMEKRNAKNTTILINTNSGEILRDNSVQTTSYFSIFFTK